MVTIITKSDDLLFLEMLSCISHYKPGFVLSAYKIIKPPPVCRAEVEFFVIFCNI